MKPRFLNAVGIRVVRRRRRIAALLCLVMALACFAAVNTGCAEAAEQSDDLFFAEHLMDVGTWYDEPEEDSGEEDSAEEDRLAALHQYHQTVSSSLIEIAKTLPEDSHIRVTYELYADLLLKPMPGRPTEAESKALSEKRLSNISSQLQEPAVAYYRKCVEVEPKITSDLCDIAESIGTEMFGLQFRLKSAADDENGTCRIADKIGEYLEEGEKSGNPITYEEATHNIKDIIRYSMAGTPNTLTENYLLTRAMLEDRGYKLYRVRNSWRTFTEEAPYRGVNTIFTSPDGIMFELQFHTAESLVAKEAVHDVYEIARNPKTTEEERQAMWKTCYDVYAALTEPALIELIH